MKISVLIHNLNRASVLELCLSSLAIQDHRPLEVVILDAGSTDDSPEIIRRASEAMRLSGIDVKVVPCALMGVAASRNLAVRYASGDLLCFLDNDAAFASSDRFCEVVKRFRSNQRLAVVSSQVFKGDSDEVDPVTWIYRRPLALWSTREFRTFVFTACGTFIRASVFRELGGFWGHLQYGREEEELSLALIDNGWELLYLPMIAIWHYRVEKGRMSLAEQRFGELRNGILVMWRRLPLPVASLAIGARICTMVRTARRERSSVRALLGAVPQAAREWRQFGLRRFPISLTGVLRYAILHAPAKEGGNALANLQNGLCSNPRTSRGCRESMVQEIPRD